MVVTIKRKVKFKKLIKDEQVVVIAPHAVSVRLKTNHGAHTQ